MNLFGWQEERHRHREWTGGYIGGRRGWDKPRGQHRHTHHHLQNRAGGSRWVTWAQLGPCDHREGWGREAPEGGDTCAHIADSLCLTAKASTTLQSNDPPN